MRYTMRDTTRKAGQRMKLMVLDGNSILNRAYHGVAPLITRQGLHTQAIFGFLNTFLPVENRQKPDALCVTFDGRAEHPAL